jgi:hypothetical protein
LRSDEVGALERARPRLNVVILECAKWRVQPVPGVGLVARRDDRERGALGIRIFSSNKLVLCDLRDYVILQKNQR